MGLVRRSPQTDGQKVGGKRRISIRRRRLSVLTMSEIRSWGSRRRDLAITGAQTNAESRGASRSQVAHEPKLESTTTSDRDRRAQRGARQRALSDKRYGVIQGDPAWRFQPNCSKGELK